jgi:hypothetical protein
MRFLYALAEKERLPDKFTMSAIPPKADIAGRDEDVPLCLNFCLHCTDALLNIPVFAILVLSIIRFGAAGSQSGTVTTDTHCSPRGRLMSARHFAPAVLPRRFYLH